MSQRAMFNDVNRRLSEDEDARCNKRHLAGATMAENSFVRLHRDHVKPMVAQLAKQRGRRPAPTAEEVTDYLRSLRMFVRPPRGSGGIDVNYQIHALDALGRDGNPLVSDARKEQLLTRVYETRPRSMINVNSATISRGPCRFGRMPRDVTTIADNVYTFTPQRKDGRIRLPADLNALLEHAVGWGAAQALRTPGVVSGRSSTNVTKKVLKTFRQGPSANPSAWGPQLRAVSWMNHLAKSLNIGKLPNVQAASDTSSAFDIWTLIQAHMWSGHRCLASEFKRNFSRGFEKGLKYGQGTAQGRGQAGGQGTAQGRGQAGGQGTAQGRGQAGGQGTTQGPGQAGGGQGTAQGRRQEAGGRRGGRLNSSLGAYWQAGGRVRAARRA